MRLVTSLFFLAVCLLVHATKSFAVEQINIKFTSDPSLLPYSIDVIINANLPHLKPVRQVLKVYKVASGQLDSAVLVHGVNKPPANGKISSIVAKIYPQNIHIYDSQLHGTLFDFKFFQSTAYDDKAIVLTCYGNDSAFVMKYDPVSGEKDICFLSSGIDLSGDDEWCPAIPIIQVFDYDNDGRDEAFIQVFAAIDKEPRELFCVDLDKMQIEWRLPLACAISQYSNDMLFLTEHGSIRTIFASYGPQNGVEDSNFSDEYGYVTAVDKSGNIIFNHLVATDFASPLVYPYFDSDSSFLLYHQYPFDLELQGDSLPSPANLLSIVSVRGEILKTLKVKDQVRQIWTIPDRVDTENLLYTTTTAGSIYILDNNLNLLSESKNTPMLRFQGLINLDGEKDAVMVFSTNGAVTFYSMEFEQLGYAKVMASEGFSPIVLDSNGNVNTFVLSMSQSHAIASIKRKGTADYISILFWKYQYYIIAFLIVILASLFLMSLSLNRTTRTRSIHPRLSASLWPQVPM